MIASACWRNDYFGQSVAVTHPSQLPGAKILILWGGEDIAPSIYAEYASPFTQASFNMSKRDKIEKALVEQASYSGIPILGVCRGMQMIAALSGGALYQHVENHESGYHDITYQGTTIKSNSCHHQMVKRFDGEVLASTPCLSPTKYTADGEVKTNDPEPEIIHIPKLKAIGVQGHPEWMPKDSDFVQLVIKLCEEKLGVKL